MKRLYLCIIFLFGTLSVFSADVESEKNSEEIEASLLKKLPEVKRNGLNLVISTLKKPVSFPDNLREGESYNKQRLAGVFHFDKERKDYLVSIEGYEGAPSFYLINGQTGQQARLEAEPVLSPGHKRYLVAVPYSASGFNGPPLLMVISAKDYSEETIFHFDDPGTILSGPSNAKWINDNAISYIKETQSPQSTRVPSGPFIMEFKNGKWGTPHSPK